MRLLAPASAAMRSTRAPPRPARANSAFAAARMRARVCSGSRTVARRSQRSGRHAASLTKRLIRGGSSVALRTGPRSAAGSPHRPPAKRGGRSERCFHRIRRADSAAGAPAGHPNQPTCGDSVSRYPLHPHAARGRAFARTGVAAAALWALCGGTAHAFEIDTGNPDLSIRWDNTVRANLRGPRRRPRQQDRQLGAVRRRHLQLRQRRPGGQAPRSAVASSTSSTRSASAAASAAPPGTTAPTAAPASSNPNPPLVNIPSYINNQYSQHDQAPVPRRHPASCSTPSCSAASTSATCRSTPSSAATRFYWGESLFLGGNLNSIAYAQNPLDLQKGFATPGTEAKELFRPLNQLSAAGAGDRHAVAGGAVMLEWEAARYPEGGTYLGPVDFVFNGPDRQFLSAGLGFAAARPGVRTRAERRVGPVGALEPAVARRHDGLVLPQLRRQAAADAADAGRRRTPASTT